MLVQVGLCRTCSETTLVFPRGGLFHHVNNEMNGSKDAHIQVHVGYIFYFKLLNGIVKFENLDCY